MAFNANNLTLWSSPPRNHLVGLPQWWGYETTDSIATVEAADYFNLNLGLLIGGNSTWYVGDLLYCVCSNGVAQLQIATVAPNVTTTASSASIPAGSITNAMLGANIVESGNIANNAVGSAQTAVNLMQYATVTGINPATLYSAGTQLVAAPGAGNLILPIALNFNYIYSTAQYTSGGPIAVQYGSTVHGAGQDASAVLAAATLNGYTANEAFNLAVEIAGVTSASINEPLYLAATTNNFATGAGTITAYVSYIIVPAS